MRFEGLKFSKINHSQLLIIHQIDKCPKSLFSVFNMIQKNCCNHVHSLCISDLRIIDGVDCEDFFQLHREFFISIECGTIRVGSINIFPDLFYVLKFSLIVKQVFVEFLIFWAIIFCPKFLPLAGKARTPMRTASPLNSTQIHIFL